MFFVFGRLKCILTVLKLWNNTLRTTASMVIPKIMSLLYILRINVVHMVKLISKLNFPKL